MSKQINYRGDVMIHCPYCGTELRDESESCSNCGSFLVEGKRKSNNFPKALHPVSAMIVVIVLSAVLVGVSISDSDKNKESTLSAVPVKESKEMETSSPKEKKPLDKKRAERNRPVPPEKRNRRPKHERIQPNDVIEPIKIDYNEGMEYYSSLKEILDEFDLIAVDLDELRESEDKANVPKMGEKIRQLQSNTQRIRQMQVPEVLKNSHNKVRNSLAVKQRGYRNFMVYKQSGDMQKLDRAKKDLETSNLKRVKGMKEIDDYISSLVPPPKVDPPKPKEEKEKQPEKPEAIEEEINDLTEEDNNNFEDAADSENGEDPQFNGDDETAEIPEDEFNEDDDNHDLEDETIENGQVPYEEENLPEYELFPEEGEE
jgi:predicted nucleic acid-binding Zn ribbon protein